MGKTCPNCPNFIAAQVCANSTPRTREIAFLDPASLSARFARRPSRIFGWRRSFHGKGFAVLLARDVGREPPVCAQIRLNLLEVVAHGAAELDEGQPGLPQIDQVPD